MRKEYELSKESGKKHLVHLLKLFASAIIMAIICLVLGLKKWTLGQYVWVNIPVLGIGVICVNLLARFGGRFDGSEHTKQDEKKFLIVSAAVAAAIWLIVIILRAAPVLAGFFFIADMAMVIALFVRFWLMLKGMWQMLISENDESGNKISYPGSVVMHEVHVAENLTSPFGKILFRGNAALFVLPESNNGFVLVNPNGTMELKKTTTFKNEVKENNLSVLSLMHDAERGTKRMIRLIEDACKKHQIPVPEFNYNFVLFLPNFEPGNVTWDQDSFVKMGFGGFFSSNKKYQKYQKMAVEQDYFDGKACFTTTDLSQALTIMSQNGSSVDERTIEIIADEIAKACELELRA